MFQWIKKGLIYNPAQYSDRPDWRWDTAQGENTLVFDDFVRVYCCSREKPNEKGQTRSRIGFVDLDRNDLTKIRRVSEKPIFELGELGCFDEFGAYPFCPVRVGEKIYGYYGGVTRCESVPFNAAIGLVISTDSGETFKRLGNGPVLSYSYDEPFVIASPKVRIFDGKWYMWYSAGREWTPGKTRPEIYYKLRMAVSEDGINWTKLHRDILPDKLGEREAQACADISFANGKYHMFYCYRQNEDFRNNPNNSYRIGYASSVDLLHWTRQDELAGLDISPEKDAFDSEMVAYPHLLQIDGKTYLFYLGNNVGREGFGLAELDGVLQ